MATKHWLMQHSMRNQTTKKRKSTFDEHHNITNESVYESEYKINQEINEIGTEAEGRGTSFFTFYDFRLVFKIHLNKLCFK